MKIAVCILRAKSPISFSRHYEVDKFPGELPKDYEVRTWRSRCHTEPQDEERGRVVIPATMLSNNIKTAAKYMALQIPGKGKSTYTKHFEAGVMVFDSIPLPLTRDQVKGEWLFVPSDGKRGGGSRVPKCFPIIERWEGQVAYHILDPIITEDVFRNTLVVGGDLIGLGRFRARNLGTYGRFEVMGIEWKLDERVINNPALIGEDDQE